jgi:hypothetical protein
VNASEEIVAVLQEAQRDAKTDSLSKRWATIGNINSAIRNAPFMSVPVVPNLDEQILTMVEGERARGSLFMRSWHAGRPRIVVAGKKCGTTHCRAGWAVALAGEAGWALEKRVGTAVAGTMIYAASAGYVPDFYDYSDASALEDIRDHASMAASDAAVAS